MEENDVREIFAPFGEIVNMDMSKDEISRTNKGYAFIEYKTVKVGALNIFLSNLKVFDRSNSCSGNFTYYFYRKQMMHCNQ